MRARTKPAPASLVAGMQVLRDPEPPLRYPWWERWSDRRAGRHDAAVDAQGAEGGRGQARGTTAAATTADAWLDRNHRTYQERDRRELLAATSAAGPLLAQLAKLTSAGEAAETSAAQARQSRSAMPQEPTVEQLAARRPGEQSDPDGAVQARRRRDHAAALQAAEATVRALDQQAENLAEQAAGLRRELEQLYDAARLRTQRLRRHHERRAASYLHAYTRVLRQRCPEEADRLLDPDSAELPEPTWTNDPCPWTSQPGGTTA